jgi:hypothetical protein
LNNEKIEEIKLDFEDASIMANKKAECPSYLQTKRNKIVLKHKK